MTAEKHFDFCFVCEDLVLIDDMIMGMCGECWDKESEALGDTGIVPLKKKIKVNVEG